MMHLLNEPTLSLLDTATDSRRSLCNAPAVYHLMRLMRLISPTHTHDRKDPVPTPSWSFHFTYRRSSLALHRPPVGRHTYPSLSVLQNRSHRMKPGPSPPRRLVSSRRHEPEPTRLVVTPIGRGKSHTGDI
jgi:hypothetical protein